jgi:kumamolisin
VTFESDLRYSDASCRPIGIACGGTSIKTSGTTIIEEFCLERWQARRWRVSGFFALPACQNGLHLTLTSGGNQALTMRGIPDVSGNADPETGYNVRIDGTDTVIGGTSAVVPLWAGLIARINSTRGSPVGLINPQL